MKLSPKAQTSINKVIEKFKTGDLSVVTKIARLQLATDAPVNKWSLSNKVLAFLQSDELDCRGFKQWREVGRTVKKGSSAVYILRPQLAKIEAENEDKEKNICVGFAPIPVFAASCTDGSDSLPSYEPIKYPPLLEVAQKFGIAVEYAPISPDKLGDCQTNGSKIRLGTHESSVFFHELTHAIHARIDGGLKNGQNSTQETIAEFTSVVLMDLYCLGDSSGKAWKYISKYSEDPLIAITKAMGTVEKVLKVLLEEEK
jgi:hypothetical protein